METKDGNKETKIYDKVLVSIGRRPYTEGLGCEVRIFHGLAARNNARFSVTLADINCATEASFCCINTRGTLESDRSLFSSYEHYQVRAHFRHIIYTSITNKIGEFRISPNFLQFLDVCSMCLLCAYNISA